MIVFNLKKIIIGRRKKIVSIKNGVGKSYSGAQSAQQDSGDRRLPTKCYNNFDLIGF